MTPADKDIAEHEAALEQLQREAAEAEADQQEKPLAQPAPAENVRAARELAECCAAQDPAAADAADGAPAVGRRPERARRRPPCRAEAEAESYGKSEEGPRAPRAVVLAAQQLAANRMLPAKCAAQLCPEHAAPLAATRLQAASQSATAATAPGTSPPADQVATVASTVAAALVAAGLDVAQAAQLAQRAAVEAGQQAMPAAAAACAVPAAPSAVPAEMLPAEVAAPDVHQRRFPSLSSLTSLQQVWDLMNKGINGRPSLVSLEVASKNRWRKGRNAKETQNYNKQWETLKAFVA